MRNLNTTRKSVTYDDVLPYLGQFGRYQKRIFVLLCLPTVSCALHKLGGVFLQARAQHRCRLPHEEGNVTFEAAAGDCTLPDNSSCASWVYDTAAHGSTVTSEFDLVCKDAWFRAMADSLFMVGVLLGSIIFGELSDRYGRRPTFFTSLVLQVAAGLLAAAAPNFTCYIIARMLIGASTSGVFLVAYVLAMEMVGPRKRLHVGVICQFFFTGGYMLTALFAYFIRDWRMLQVALSLPGVLFLSYWWFVPESARWLLAQGRHEEARQLLLKAAVENQATIPEDVLRRLAAPALKPAAAQDHKPSVLDLVRHANLRSKALNIFFCWFVNSGTYYGLSWNTSNLGGNEYINFIISAAVEFPAFFFLLLTLNRWGRKSILCGCMLTGGVVLMLTLLVPSGMNWLVVTLAMAGKMGITASYTTVYIFSIEQFPTVVRNVALGASSTSARIGGILAPCANLLADYWQPLPLLIFGSLAVSSGLLTLLLPETLNRKLPDTIEEGEQFGKSCSQQQLTSCSSSGELCGADKECAPSKQR
ncbi:organic cation transporter protein-like isoform X2 [Bacillus rossius redtenbacheri]|uniref:organic cation transporter protein-like isoform X2 n=1 Tax=Bacillus rossius redtenbacheri TaxID=93214 RepID=UPI002FDEB2A1